jgi:hypothetical protein
VTAVGGGRVMVDCGGPGGRRYPLLLDVASGRWNEVPGAGRDSSPYGHADTTVFSALGERWLRVLEGSRSGVTRTWIDWRTGARQPDTSDARRIPDPDNPDLYVVPCDGMRLDDPMPWAFASPVGLVNDAVEGLRLARCGSSRTLPIDPTAEGIYAARLAEDVVTWTPRAAVPRVGAYLVSCRIRLLWHPHGGGWIAHAGRVLLRATVPFRSAATGPVERLNLPQGCPQAPAARPLRVSAAGAHIIRVSPHAADWPASARWGRARARILPGTFATPRLVLAPGVRLTIAAPEATAVLWAASDGPLRHGRRGADGSWSFELPQRAIRRLRLVLRFVGDGRASYWIDMRERGA